MRYFSNALEDRRVYIRNPGINPYANSYNTPYTELRNSLTTGQPLTKATASNVYTNPTGLYTNPAGLYTNPADSYTNAGSSNTYELLSNVNGSNNDAITSDWTSAGAFKPSGSIALTEFKARFGGEVPVDANGNFDKEAMIAKASAGFLAEYGGNGDGAFSVSDFMNGNNTERMFDLGQMKAEREAQKAAKYEEDMRLAMNRDAAKAASNNPGVGNNPTAQIINTIVGQVIGMFA